MTLEIQLNDEQLAKIADMVAAKLKGPKGPKGQEGPKTAYTVSEAAALLNICTKTVHNHIKAGVIPTIPGIGATRIPSAYVDGLLNTGGNGQ